MKAVTEREALNNLMHEEKTLRDAFNAATDSLEVCQRKIDKAKTDQASLSERSETVSLFFEGVGKRIELIWSVLIDVGRGESEGSFG